VRETWGRKNVGHLFRKGLFNKAGQSKDGQRHRRVLGGIRSQGHGKKKRQNKLRFGEGKVIERGKGLFVSARTLWGGRQSDYLRSGNKTKKSGDFTKEKTLLARSRFSARGGASFSNP